MLIDHVAIVVQDLDEALQFYGQALGLTVVERQELPQEGVEIAFLPLGDAEIELLRPLDPQNSIGRYLTKRGEGIHHLCLRVEDIEAAVAQLQERGARLAGGIRQRENGTRYVFIHPKSTHGVLLELYQPPEA